MPSYHFSLDWGLHTMMRLVELYDFETVLDVGSGEGEHTRFLRHFGKQVFSVDLSDGADYKGDFNQLTLDREFDAVWCSHVLEHQRNVGMFLEKIYAALRDDGVLAITVPVHPRERLVAGHVTSWNAGLLCYNLVMAGFDCRQARLLQSFELGLIVRKQRAVHDQFGQSSASHLTGDLAKIAKFFPFAVEQGCNAEVLEANWGDREYELPPPSVPGEVVVTSKNAALRLSAQG